MTTFNYDATGKVTAADHSSQTDENYGYDLNGNRNTSGFTTGQNNQTLAGDGFAYTYDNEGNRTSRTETATGKVQEYVWDYRNRLVTVRDRNTAGGAIVKQVDYTYDAMNRLVKRTFDADGAGAGSAADQFWAYDEGINALFEFSGSSASNMTHRYLWSDQIDELIADSQITSLSNAGNTLWALPSTISRLSGTIRISSLPDPRAGHRCGSIIVRLVWMIFSQMRTIQIFQAGSGFTEQTLSPPQTFKAMG